MGQYAINLVLLGMLSSGLGTAATVSPAFAEWYVKRSGKGRMWAHILGEEKSHPVDAAILRSSRSHDRDRLHLRQRHRGSLLSSFMDYGFGMGEA